MKIGLWVIALGVVACALMGGLWFVRQRAAAGVPTYEEVRAAYRPSQASLLDRNGEVVHERRVDPHGRRLAWTALADISPALQAAVIVSEDRRFYRHRGVDVLAILGAVARWPTEGVRRGASTISMQLVNFIHPELRQRHGSRTLARKWRQIQRAWSLERAWTKAEILEAYLNLVSYRGELQGVAAAASGLFAKAPHGLAEAEAAVLAALLRGPNAAPAAVTRRAWALVRAQQWSVAYEDLTAAVDRALQTASASASMVALAPHLAQRLLQAAHATPLRSTLDRRLQAMVTAALKLHLLAIRSQGVHDGAVLVADNQRGEVLAYVAGSGDLSSARYVDGIQARRQTGSLLKPFLYGMALDGRLLTPASLLEDEPLQVPVEDGLYRPRNYDERFRGLVSVRTALAGSLNIPAVRTLALVGTEAFALQLRRLGLEAAVESGEYYGPSLALGSVDASLWELVNAYRTLANGGVWSPLRVLDIADDVSEDRWLYSAEAAFLVSQILSDRESRSHTFGLENPLSTRFWSAVKTGTSKDMRDNWCIGYTGQYTVGVWVGNLSGGPMRQVSGVAGAAPVWLEVVNWLHRQSPSFASPPPAEVVAREVGFPNDVEPRRREWFLRGTEPGFPAIILAAGEPKIEAPSAGEVIALDPDIPPAYQRVLFRAREANATVRWRLNGRDLGPAAGAWLWQPVPGQHTLSLVDDQERPWDTVTFEVRPLVTTVDRPRSPPPP
jgi:penicillin-binding protein 1C